MSDERKESPKRTRSNRAGQQEEPTSLTQYVKHFEDETAEEMLLLNGEGSGLVMPDQGLTHKDEHGREHCNERSEPVLDGSPGVSGREGKLPRYQNRRLFWRGKVVLEYHRNATNQIPVLQAFEEQGWYRCHQGQKVRWIDNPLGTGPEEEQRLYQTVTDLNRQLRRTCIGSLLQFSVNGRGRVEWHERLIPKKRNSS